jgi:hypothetical protein
MRLKEGKGANGHSFIHLEIRVKRGEEKKRVWRRRAHS